MDAIALLQFAAPVALAAVGETVVQKSGVINIGLEGAMLNGAFFGTLVSFSSGNAALGLTAAVTAAVATNLAFGLFTVILAADQVVVGTAINLLAAGLTGTLFRVKFGQTGRLLSVPRLPVWHGIDPLLVMLLLSVPLVGGALRSTAWGLGLRSAGEYPKAAEAAGLSVYGLRLQALVIGGVFAGLGGAYLSLVYTGAFAENMTAGRGFIAIAMVTFGRWRMGLVFGASLLIGLAGSLQFWFQGLGWNVPFQLFVAMPYLMALLVLVLVGKGGIAPQSLAQSYRPEES